MQTYNDRALDYNALGTAWRDIAQLAAAPAGASEQQTLGFDSG